MAASFQLILDSASPQIVLSSSGVVAENDLVTVFISANKVLDTGRTALVAQYPDESTEELTLIGSGTVFSAEINLAGKGTGELKIVLLAYDEVWNESVMERSVNILPVINRLVTIGSEPVNVQQNTLNITDRINSRSTASFTVFSPNNERKFSIGQEVVVIDQGVTIFAGTISNVNEVSETIKDVFYNISAVDFCQLIDKRIVAKTYENKTAGFIVRDLIANIFFDEGVTEGNITDGPVIKKAVFNYVKGDKALDQIKDVTGLNWNINHTKQLNLFDRSEYTAPFRLTDTSFNYKGLTIQSYRGEYRNRQFVRAGKDVTQELEEDLKPTPNGQTREFFTRYPIAEKPRLFIDAAEVPAEHIGVNGIDKDNKWYFSYNSNKITQDGQESPLSNQVLSTIYKGLYPIIVIAENSSAVEDRKEVEGGSGLYEHIQVSQEIDLRDMAIDLANGLLLKYGVIPKIAGFSTYQNGLKSGQLLTIKNTKHGIDSTFLIEQVTARADKNLINYNIKAIDGHALGGWENLFKQTKVSDIAIKDNEILVLLSQSSERWIWSETLHINIYSHPVPSDTIFPSETLYPSSLLESTILTSTEVVD